MASVGESPVRQRDLVFDFGFHRGEDTGYYLAMGQRVVAVDASAELIAAGRERFAAALASGQLTLVHAALIGSAQRADTTALLFYPHPQRSEWGSVDLRWVRRYERVDPIHKARRRKRKADSRRNGFGYRQQFTQAALESFAPSDLFVHKGCVVLAPCDGDVLMSVDASTDISTSPSHGASTTQPL